MAQVAVRVGPFVPDAHTVLLQIFHIGVAFEKPQQLVDNRFEVQLLGGEQGEPVVQVESHLIAEYAMGTRARAVLFEDTVVEHMLQQVEILFHGGLCVI